MPQVPLPVKGPVKGRSPGSHGPLGPIVFSQQIATRYQTCSLRGYFVGSVHKNLRQDHNLLHRETASHSVLL